MVMGNGLMVCGIRDTLDAGRRTGRSLPEAWETGLPGEESPNSAGQCAG